jgi:hypothetical protein
MENKPIYKIDSKGIELNPLTLLHHHEAEYQAPGREDLKNLKILMNWNNAELAKLLGKHYSLQKGSSTIRKWLTESEKEYVPIPFVNWRYLLGVAGIVDVSKDFELIQQQQHI